MNDVSPIFFLGSLLVMFLGGLFSGRFSNEVRNCELRATLAEMIDRELEPPPPCLVCGVKGKARELTRVFALCPACQPATEPELVKLRRETA